jgi:hypothetical protein
MAYSAWSVIAGETPTATKWNVLGTNDADANTRVENLEIGVMAVNTESDASTITFDLSDGKLHKATLGGNRTLAVSNATVGQSFVVRLAQDGNGLRTVTWWSTIRWVYETEPVLSPGGGMVDVFGFICIASGQYDGFVVGQNL